jgi:hypothetical protein
MPIIKEDMSKIFVLLIFLLNGLLPALPGTILIATDKGKATDNRLYNSN